MWVKIDSAAPHHHKLLSAGAEAAWLWLAGLCYANAHATDGVIPSSALSALYPTTKWTLRRVLKLADRLVEVGLWHPRDDGGWTIHDYGEYQQPALRTEVDSRKLKWREKKRAQRAKTDSSDLPASSIGREISPGRHSNSSARTASVPSVSPGDMQTMSPGDTQEESQEDAPTVSPESTVTVSRGSDPSRSEPIRAALESRETSTRKGGAEGAIAAQSSKRVKELIEVLRERCEAVLLFGGADASAIRGALDQRMSEVNGRLDRSRCELLAGWYAAGAMAWRKTPLSLRELSEKKGMLSDHFERAARWDRAGRPPLHEDIGHMAERADSSSTRDTSSREDPLIAQARRRRGAEGE